MPVHLQDALLSSDHDLIYLAGHFSHASALAADDTTRLIASTVAASTVDLRNALVYSIGCHSGYNTVNDDNFKDATGATVTREPDWPQAWAQKGATWIAGTGYQYGDRDFMEFGERLYLDFTGRLRKSGAAVPVGKALVQAKQDYLAYTGVSIAGVDKKTVLVATLYGLPMLSVSLPGAPVAPPAPPPLPGTPGTPQRRPD